MSYRDYPPGRARMLAYANEVDIRFRSRNLGTHEAIADVLQWTNITNLTFGSIRPSYNRRNAIYMSTSPLQEYEILSELPDVKVGLVAKNLLEKTKVENSSDVSFCAICQQDIFLDIIRKLECGHSYHIKCIDTWFVENKKCPQCRYEI